MRNFVKTIALLMVLGPLTMKAQNTLDTQDTSQEPAFVFVEQRPEYPGGPEAMYRDLSSNLKYPQKALENEATGQVLVEFVVEKDGSITNVKVIKDNVGYGAGTK